MTLIGAVALAYWLNQSHSYRPETSAVIVSIAAGLWIWVWEFILPYRNAWNKTDSDLTTDTIHLAVTAMMTTFVKPLYLFILIWSLLVSSSIAQRTVALAISCSTP